MFDCRYYNICCFVDDSCNGEPECPKRDHCQFYSPMPDVKALLALAEELEKCAWYFGLDFDEDEPIRDRLKEASEDFAGCASCIREALGVDDGR